MNWPDIVEIFDARKQRYCDRSKQQKLCHLATMYHLFLDATTHLNKAGYTAQDALSMRKITGDGRTDGRTDTTSYNMAGYTAQDAPRMRTSHLRK